MKKEVVNKYKSKKVGITGSKIAGGHYLVEDFLDEDILLGFILDLVDHETDLTKDGFNFLKEYYGLENLAELIDTKYPDFSSSPDVGQRTLDWLKVKGEFAVDSWTL